MNSHPTPLNKQSGVMLLEALISILIFSLGILAVIGLQASAISNASDAKYRTDASLLANELISQMWSQRLGPPLFNNFSNGGAGYNTWVADVNKALPGAVANPPTVTVVPFTSLVNPLNVSNIVTITINWQPPSAAATGVVHQYITVTQITQL